MIAKQIDLPGAVITYDCDGYLDRITTRLNRHDYTYTQGDGIAKRPTLKLVDDTLGQNLFLLDFEIDYLESFLAAVRHLRPGVGETDVELQISTNNSKDLEESLELLKDAWDHMPIRLRAAIAKVLEESIENGEAFIKSAREYEERPGR